MSKSEELRGSPALAGCAHSSEFFLQELYPVLALWLEKIPVARESGKAARVHSCSGGLPSKETFLAQRTYWGFIEPKRPRGRETPDSSPLQPSCPTREVGQTGQRELVKFTKRQTTGQKSTSHFPHLASTTKCLFIAVPLPSTSCLISSFQQRITRHTRRQKTKNQFEETHQATEPESDVADMLE